jgi:cytochrome P450
VFGKPETFGITCDPNWQVTFGAGVLYCLEATLAWLAGQATCQALAQ